MLLAYVAVAGLANFVFIITGRTLTPDQATNEASTSFQAAMMTDFPVTYHVPTLMKELTTTIQLLVPTVKLLETC